MDKYPPKVKMVNFSNDIILQNRISKKSKPRKSIPNAIKFEINPTL